MVDGDHVAAGEHLAVVYAAANRDPRIFDDVALPLACCQDAQVSDAAVVTPVPRRGITVVMTVGCIFLVLLASVTFAGITAPVGIVSALAALCLAILVLRRTTRRTLGRIAAWVLLGFTLLPWALIAVFWIYISFFDQLDPSLGS